MLDLTLFCLRDAAAVSSLLIRYSWNDIIPKRNRMVRIRVMCGMPFMVFLPSFILSSA